MGQKLPGRFPGARPGKRPITPGNRQIPADFVTGTIIERIPTVPLVGQLPPAGTIDTQEDNVTDKTWQKQGIFLGKLDLALDQAIERFADEGEAAISEFRDLKKDVRTLINASPTEDEAAAQGAGAAPKAVVAG